MKTSLTARTAVPVVHGPDSSPHPVPLVKTYGEQLRVRDDVCHDGWSQPHRVAFEVQTRLRSVPELDFTSLVVREVPGGVCLEGVVEAHEASPDIESLVRRVAGVNHVLNRLVVRGELLEGAEGLNPVETVSSVSMHFG